MPRNATTDDGARPAKDPQLVELGARLRSLRGAAGQTQEALADAAGVHWTYVGQIERGERNPTYKNLLKLARGLGAPLSEVVRGL
jgi:transcriptional regulator with XRE-family HTH domain